MRCVGPLANLFQALKIICKDQEAKLAPTTQGRSVNAVSTDVERLLRPKSLKDLEALQKQIEVKLQSDEPIDVEYWEQLLRNVAVYKARAQLDVMYKSIIESRLNELKREQRAQAEQAKEKLRLVLDSVDFSSADITVTAIQEGVATSPPKPAIGYSRELDPEPLLKLHAEDKGVEVLDEKDFLDKIVSLSPWTLPDVQYLTN